jgi:cystathionine beta-lyase family protein involved in aluminum resistance
MTADNFQQRVNLAASYITKGIRNSRTLDSCFEMYDGDFVVTVLVRRAMKNPKLHAAIAKEWGGEFPQQWLETAEKHAHVKTRQIPFAAAEIRAKRETEFTQWLENQQKQAA